MHGLCTYCMAFEPVTNFCISKKQESLVKVVCSKIKINYNDPLLANLNPTQLTIRVLLRQQCRDGLIHPETSAYEHYIILCVLWFEHQHDQPQSQDWSGVSSYSNCQ